MQVSWAPVAAKAAQDPQDIWFLAGVTKSAKQQRKQIMPAHTLERSWI
jgi:hypothetical protein